MEITKYKWVDGTGATRESLIVPIDIDSYETITETLINPELEKLRITKFQIDPIKNHKAIDWNSELSITLKCKEIYGEASTNRGLLIGKEYTYEDLPVLKIEYNYILDNINQITSQSSILFWYKENGDISADVKDKGFVQLSLNERRIAVQKRRSAIITLLEVKITQMLTISATSEADFMSRSSLGSQLLAACSVEINVYKDSGVSTPLIDKVNLLSSTYSFLNSFVAPNVTALQFITSFLS